MVIPTSSGFGIVSSSVLFSVLALLLEISFIFLLIPPADLVAPPPMLPFALEQPYVLSVITTCVVCVVKAWKGNIIVSPLLPMIGSSVLKGAVITSVSATVSVATVSVATVSVIAAVAAAACTIRALSTAVDMRSSVRVYCKVAIIFLPSLMRVMPASCSSSLFIMSKE